LSGTNAFCWLDGTVTISSRAPTAWATEGLHEFYRDPNSAEWGSELCRVLYHESIHFWQLLSSGYLANAIQDEWLRYREFERSACLTAPSEFVRGMTIRRPGAAFSVHELMECWARYWDVHTRSPARIIEEDDIPVPPGRITRTQQGAYTAEAFDLFMQAGKDAHLYAAPYRWVLERSGGHSALANILFPILTFHAFGSPDPITLLEESLDRALASDLILGGLDGRSGNINLDWLNNWGVVLGEAIDPARRKRGMPDFTGGWDVIARGPLGTHPIYGSYARRVAAMFGFGTLPGEAERPTSRDSVAAYRFAVVDLAGRDPRVIFAFPGQPEYRKALGSWLPPPRVKFQGMTIHASDGRDRLHAKLRAQSGAEIPTDDDGTGVRVFSDLDAGMRRFRRAEYAISIGLPANAFE
jgi:hypothetical protein